MIGPTTVLMLEKTEDGDPTNTVARDASCCCCDATLVCQSISASKSKCGFSGFIDMPRNYYLQLNFTKTVDKTSATHTGPPPEDAAINDNTFNGSGHYTYNSRYDPDDCSLTTDPGEGSLYEYDTNVFSNYRFYCHVPPYGSGSSTTSWNGTYNPGSNAWDVTVRTVADSVGATFGGCGVASHEDTSSTGAFSDGLGDIIMGCGQGIITYTTPSDSRAITHIDETGNNPATSCSRQEYQITQLSELYDTDRLKSVAIDSLPDYSGCWGCVDGDGNPCDLDTGQDCQCQASAHLSDDEYSYTIQRFKYKFILVPGQTCTLEWIERTYDEDGNCVKDVPKSFSVTPDAEESPEYEVYEPEDNGSVSIIFPTDSGSGCT